ncbi:hypothetical protein LRS03_26330 [Rhizobacter sp. J219]|uniref:hypothetical protein n=1 Tax=Rhizobacter sp. J219 TaxID=2898430 RepID=UPI002150839D|nr:hypothetical protein [Rhizobacter sp. J219]MCR5886175.1 hypothetical protein [Rhizobacter sp. J219]
MPHRGGAHHRLGRGEHGLAQEQRDQPAGDEPRRHHAHRPDRPAHRLDQHLHRAAAGRRSAAGKYSGQSGILNFSPDAPLLPATTYEVVVVAGGMKDDVGIGVAGSARASPPPAPRRRSAVRSQRATPALVGSTVGFSPASASGSNLQYS